MDLWRLALLLQLRKGDTFQTRGAMRTVEFKVMAIATATEDEAEYCYVNEDTEILCEEGETLKVCTRMICSEVEYRCLGGLCLDSLVSLSLSFFLSGPVQPRRRYYDYAFLLHRNAVGTPHVGREELARC